MRTLTGLIFYQRSGLQTITHKTGIMKLFPETLATMDLVLPKSLNESNERSSYILPAESTKKKQVAFFRLFNGYDVLETNNATMKLLQLAGCDIVIPKTQSCCGALHGHAGEKVEQKN